MRYTVQTTYPMQGTPWNPGVPVLEGYVAPCRAEPALWRPPVDQPAVTVLGTVRNEREAFLRSWEVWRRQTTPGTLGWTLTDAGGTSLHSVAMAVEYLVLDEGSTDGIDEEIRRLRDEGAPIRYARMRPPGDEGERSCTLAFNWAIRHFARGALVLPQWWDRIPGSFSHLAGLVEPHTRLSGVATSAISRHVGGSSSMEGMSPGQLRALLSSVPWREDPRHLATLAGPIGGHCVPGGATESSGLCIPRAELLALGGWDERYRCRASYVNVDLFRRVLGSGLAVHFLSEPDGANYHQSHPCPTGRAKGDGTDLLADLSVVRNGGPDGRWGELEPVEVWE